MAKLTRLTGKVFGGTATAVGADPEIGQFGSALAGTYNGTTDVATIQNLTAWSNGFIDAVTPTNQYPPLPEMTGFGKVLSYQECYLLQQGIPEWDSGTDYHTNGFCSKGGKIYISLTDNNLNNDPDSDTVNWQEFASFSLPDQAGNSGKYLTTDGTDPSWAEVTVLPDQTGNSGKLLSTDGADAYWAATATIYPVVETYINGTSWYRIYASDSTGYRWCEQGGVSYSPWTNYKSEITLLKSYANTNYFIFTNPLTTQTTGGSTQSAVLVLQGLTTNSKFTLYDINFDVASRGAFWKTMGYIS